MRLHLTDVAVRALKPQDRQYKVWDTTTRGFGVLVGKSKSYIVMSGKERRLRVIARVGEKSLSDARTEAKKLLGNGLPARHSYQQILQLFLEDCARRNRPKTIKEYTQLLGRLPITNLDITPNEAARALASFNSEAIYNHILVAAKVFFNWCIKRQYVDRNPFAGLSQHKAEARARVLSDEELVRIWRACDQLGRGKRHDQLRLEETPEEMADNHALPAHHLPVSFCRIVQLLILTAQRRGEIAGLRQDNIDLTNNLICLKPSQTKNAKEHSFPISALAISILKSRMNSVSIKPETLLFPARGQPENSFNGWSKSKAALDQASGVTDWTLHDIRRTVATRMAEMGLAPHIVERILNHAKGSLSPIALTYNRATYHHEMRDAFERWQSHLTEKISAPVM